MEISWTDRVKQGGSVAKSEGGTEYLTYNKEKLG